MATKPRRRTWVPRPYPNIKAEMARNGVTQCEIAVHYKIAPTTVNNKINGRTALTVDEIVDWRDTFMPDATLDYLLARD